MTDRLHAWLEGGYVGEFVEDAGGRVQLRYDDAASDAPVSLSLPRDGSASARAAERFLDNLLPDRREARDWMRRVTGAASTRTFDLLAAMGGDVAGGLVLLPTSERPKSPAEALLFAEDDAIAYRISSLHQDPDQWWERSEPARFSLAGSQPKFALASIDGSWFWSNESVASTHIVKPAHRENRGAEAAEVAAETLARQVGLDAPAASVLEVAGERAYIVERFDRAPRPNGFVARLHMEDLAQALGLEGKNKYSIGAKPIITTLRQHDPSDGAAHDFVRQLAFNAAIGNADAHAKNYSVLLRPTGITLSPLYDALPTRLWPQYDQQLAMRIGGAQYPQELTHDHWSKLARASGLDEERVRGDVQAVYDGVAERAETAWSALDPDQASRMRDLALEQTAKIARRSP
ncbi:HipA domain-containing protein [Curtobacterium sp. VKM Ac-1393]|uniref:HipA domain-containing protein n=1 Tax=Curtobacterium sp. VKM Ac-1393 TaxID=2783814 RepID=UPI00188A4177|nr:HipA domain-containing protein [Curtobacterium sp. VKM Ac-1393]MBF4606759.1 HipA domain-containing protein [Curtobacterium sp. VKM Ac-1393]